MGQKNTVFQKLPAQIRNNYIPTKSSTILKHKNSSNQIYLHSYKHHNQIKAQSLSYYRLRGQLNAASHQHLVMLVYYDTHSLSQQQQAFSCTISSPFVNTSKIINFLHQYHSSRLQTQIINRHNNPFSEKQIWSVILSSVIGAYTLVQNGFKQPILSPKAMMISQQGFIKVGQWQFVNQQQHYEEGQLLLNSQKSKNSILMNYYWAPEGPAFMQETLSIVFCGHKKKKGRNSQIFCLGMTVLEMILRKPLYQLQTLSEKQIQLYISLAIKKRAEQKKQLSDKLMQVLKRMLCWDYTRRVKYQQLYEIFIGMLHGKKEQQVQKLGQDKYIMESTYGQSLDNQNRLGSTMCVNFQDSRLGSNEGDDSHPLQQNIEFFVQGKQLKQAIHDKKQMPVMAKSQKLQPNNTFNMLSENILVKDSFLGSEIKENAAIFKQFNESSHLQPLLLSSISNRLHRDCQDQIDYYYDVQQFISQIDQQNVDKFEVEEWTQQDDIKRKMSHCSSQISFKQQKFFNITNFTDIPTKQQQEIQEIQNIKYHRKQQQKTCLLQLQQPSKYYNIPSLREKQIMLKNKANQQSKQNFKGVINQGSVNFNSEKQSDLFTDQKLMILIRNGIKQKETTKHKYQQQNFKKQQKQTKMPEIRIEDGQQSQKSIQNCYVRDGWIHKQSVAKGYYQGQKTHGKRSGFGTFYYSEGGKYIGHWVDNKMNGRGTLYYPDNTIAYEGMWKDDELHGIGTLYNEHPQKIVLNMGFFDYSNFDQCQQYWVSYSGQFKHDDKDGKGQLVLSNGQRFVGNFKNDFVDGAGVFFRKDGSKVIGYWRSNQMIQGSTQRMRTY